MAKKPSAPPAATRKRWWHNTQNSEAQSKKDKADYLERVKNGTHRPAKIFISSVGKRDDSNG